MAHKVTHHSRRAIRFAHALLAPIGVHSFLDAFVLADLADRVRAGAISMVVTVGVWYMLRTIVAFIAAKEI